MKTEKVSKEFNQKLTSLWEQCIDWKKRDIEHSKKHNKDMVKFHTDVLKQMEKEYEQVKSKITKTS